MQENSNDKWHACPGSDQEEEEEQQGGGHGRTATRPVMKALGRWVGGGGVADTDGKLMTSELRPGWSENNIARRGVWVNGWVCGWVGCGGVVVVVRTM